MKTTMFILFLMVSHFTAAQDISQEKLNIKKVVQHFRHGIIEKDSALFHGLFHEDPVVWIGLVKDKTQKKILEREPANTKNLFRDTYRSFLQYILKAEIKKRNFKNIKIINDDVIATVTFDHFGMKKK